MLALFHRTAARDCREDLGALDADEGSEDSPEDAWSVLINTNDNYQPGSVELTCWVPLQKQCSKLARRPRCRLR